MSIEKRNHMDSLGRSPLPYAYASECKLINEKFLTYKTREYNLISPVKYNGTTVIYLSNKKIFKDDSATEQVFFK